MNPQALRNRVTDRAPGIERAVGILEDHLHLAPDSEEVPPVEVSDVGTVEIDRSRRWLEQAHQHPAEGGLSTARLSDQTEGLTPIDIEVDVGHCPDPALGSLKNPAADREVLGDPLELDELFFHGLVCGISETSAVGPGTSPAGLLARGGASSASDFKLPSSLW